MVLNWVMKWGKRRRIMPWNFDCSGAVVFSREKIWGCKTSRILQDGPEGQQNPTWSNTWGSCPQFQWCFCYLEPWMKMYLLSKCRWFSSLPTMFVYSVVWYDLLNSHGFHVIFRTPGRDSPSLGTTRLTYRSNHQTCRWSMYGQGIQPQQGNAKGEKRGMNVEIYWGSESPYHL